MSETKSDPTKKKRSPTRRRTLRRVVFGVVVVALLVLVGISLIPEKVPVDVATARRADLVVSVDEDGTTRVKDRYVVSAPLAGELARIDLHPGDVIHEGDVIARVLPSSTPLLDARTRTELTARLASAEAGIRQADASVARARAASELAARELERSRALAAEGSLASQQLERTETDARARREELASAEFGARIARHERTMAAAALGNRVDATAEDAPFDVRSPITGRVLRVVQASAGPVAPGTPLLEIGDSTALEIVVDVLTSDATRITPGQRVVIDRWGGDRTLEGRVRLVEPSAFTRVSALGVEEQRVNVIVDLVSSTEQWASLGDGYRVEASIVVDEARGALVVPELALFRDGDRLALYEMVDGVARLRHVRVARRNGIDAEIRDGIAVGSRVILHPSERVRDGARVEVR